MFFSCIKDDRLILRLPEVEQLIHDKLTFITNLASAVYVLLNRLCANGKAWQQLRSDALRSAYCFITYFNRRSLDDLRGYPHLLFRMAVFSRSLLIDVLKSWKKHDAKPPSKDLITCQYFDSVCFMCVITIWIGFGLPLLLVGNTLHNTLNRGWGRVECATKINMCKTKNLFLGGLQSQGLQSGATGFGCGQACIELEFTL